MKIKALRRFQDYKENVVREVGDEFEVTEERLEEIKTGLAKFGEGDWVEGVVEPEPIKGEIKEEIPLEEGDKSEITESPKPKTAPTKKTNTIKGKA